MLADGAALVRSYICDIVEERQSGRVARRIAVDLGSVELLANVAGIGDLGRGAGGGDRPPRGPTTPPT
jgi:hypothetical protein